MPAVRTLVPLEINDEQIPVGEVINASDEEAAAWRAAGKVSLVADEEASARAAEQGHYTDVVGRDDVTPLTPGASQPGPQADEDDDEPKSKKGKK